MTDKPSVRDLHLAHVRSVTDRMRRLGGDADRQEAKRNAGRPPGPGFPPFTNLEHNTDLSDLDPPIWWTGDIPTNRDNGPAEDPTPAYWFSG